MESLAERKDKRRKGEMPKEIVAPCGFVCSDCPAFEGNILTKEDQDTAYEGWHKYWGIQTRPERVRCRGCHSPRPDGYIFPEMGCRIKPCVESKGLESCAFCPDLPCDIMKQRFSDCEGVHKDWAGRIPDEDRKRFLDPYRPREVLEGIKVGKKRQPRKGNH